MDEAIRGFATGVQTGYRLRGEVEREKLSDFNLERNDLNELRREAFVGEMKRKLVN